MLFYLFTVQSALCTRVFCEFYPLFLSNQTTASKQLINTVSTTNVIHARKKHYPQNTNTVTSSFEEQQIFSRNSSYLPLGCVQQAIPYQKIVSM